MAAYELASKSVSLRESDDPIEYYFERGWTDGLPVVPPTAEKIGAFLDAAGRSPSEILGTEPCARQGRHAGGRSPSMR